VGVRVFGEMKCWTKFPEYGVSETWRELAQIVTLREPLALSERLQRKGRIGPMDAIHWVSVDAFLCEGDQRIGHPAN
jgi:hypothetical protein